MACLGSEKQKVQRRLDEGNLRFVEPPIRVMESGKCVGYRAQYVAARMPGCAMFSIVWLDESKKHVLRVADDDFRCSIQ